MIELVRALLSGFIRFLTGVHQFHASTFPTTPFVAIANHTSHIDTLLIWSVMPPSLRATMRPIAGGDYWMQGALRRWFLFSVLNGIAIERANVNRTNNPVLPIQQALSEGSSVLIFPEGTRSTTGSMKEFKSGIYHILRATVNEVSIVPIGLRNLQRVMPKGEILPLPLICTIRIGQPLTLNSDESKDGFLRRCESAVQNLISD